MLDFCVEDLIKQMKLRILSDIHLEFGKYFIPKMSGEQEQVLILAGDVGLIIDENKYVDFFDDVSKRFYVVLLIPGNHEYYHGSLDLVWRLLDYNNVVDLSQIDYMIVGNRKFVGRTLWTNLNNNNENDKFCIRRGMNDFHLIQGLNTDVWYQRFKEDLSHIIKYSDENTVVVTHHAPSFKSVPTRYHRDVLNSAYYSSLDDVHLKVKLWIHGHMHLPVKYDNVVCNPRGYPFETNYHDPCLVYEI